MSSPNDAVPETRIDVRTLAPAERHRAIFEAYDSLETGGSFVLVNDHDPRRLRDEFDLNHPSGYDWRYLRRDDGDWQVRITRLASTPLPRVLTTTAELTGDVESGGAIWRLEMSDRDLDANVIALPPGGRIEVHTGADLDVLLHVIDGVGEVVTELDPVTVHPGDVVFLPHGSRRGVTAGASGLRYLSVHRKKLSLNLQPALRVRQA